jgi:hypothetical protein
VFAAWIVLYALAAIIVAGIGFLIWTLIHLFRDSRRKSTAATSSIANDRWRR